MVSSGGRNKSAKRKADELFPSEDMDKIIIGLDFGTTYSGVAYAFTSDHEHIWTIDEWDGTNGRLPKKVPTIVNYETKKKDAYSWGYKVDKTAVGLIEGVKLLLDPDQPRPVYVPELSNAKEQLKRQGKTPSDVATDYIAAIYKHAWSKIEKKMPKAYLDMLGKQFILSVPAVWSDKAKAATLKAARSAGIHPINLISEPEAAGLYTLHSLRDKGFSVGDAFVTCDAGGGTVDLITYEITCLQPTLLREIAPATGGVSGSLLLNMRFEKHIQKLVGDEQFLRLRKTEGFREAMEQFDTRVKPAFLNRDERYFIHFPMSNLPDDKAKNIEGNCLTLTGDDLHEIFEPLVVEIKKLIGGQIKTFKEKRKDNMQSTTLKAIFLVGGFGASVYLRECIKSAHPGIEVIQPNDAWAAIVRGAVLSGLPSQVAVISNSAPVHYGVLAGAFWDNTADRGQEKHRYWDDYKGVLRVRKMRWFICLGDDLRRDRTITFPFYRALPADFAPSDLIFTNSLRVSTSALAPDYPTDLVRINCNVISDLSRIDKGEFEATTSVYGEPYIEIHYKLVFEVCSALPKFSLSFKGKTYGISDVVYSPELEVV